MHTASVSDPHLLPLTVMGLPLKVELPEVLRPHRQLVRRAWSRCVRPAGPPAEDAASGAARAPAPVRAALDALTTSVTLGGIERLRGTTLMFHAAGLADPASGATAVLVASSGTGKTTAARALGRSLAYVSDETVCVDPADLSIAPYPKPLSVVTAPGAPKDQVSPDDLHLVALSRPAHARALLLLERSPASARAHLTEPLPLVSALSTLVPNISALPSLPDPLVTLVRVIDACGGVRAVRYREIDDVAPQLVHAASRPAVPTVRAEPMVHWEPERAASWASPQETGPGWGAPGDGVVERPAPGSERHREGIRGHNAPSAPDAGAAAPGVPGTRAGAAQLPDSVALGPWVQALENPEDPSQLLLLLPERLVVLAGIGPLIWHACREDGPRSAEELTTALVEACEGHPDAARLTGESVAHLLSLGVLRPGPARRRAP